MQRQARCESETYLARQPILDVEGRVVAYELLFRQTPLNQAEIANAAQSTMSVIETSLGEIGLGDALNGKDCFLNCPDEMFCSPTLDVLPPNRFVLEVLESSDLGAEVYADCHRLRKRGFRIALDDVTAYTPSLSKILPVIDIAKVDWKHTRHNEQVALCHMLKRSGALVLAEKVETWQDFHDAAKAGASLFQGYYFSQPEMLTSKPLLPNFTAVLEIMRMLLEDEPSSRICAALANTPALLAQLLRLASSGYAPGCSRRRLASVNDALVMVGTNRLMHWCSLLLYVNRLPVGDDPLTALAVQRSELIARYINAHHPSNEMLRRKAKLAGSLSLLHVSYHCEPHDFWKDLELDEEIRDAVLTERGPIGEALAFARKLEYQMA